MFVIEQERRFDLHQVPNSHVRDFVAPARIQLAQTVASPEPNQSLYPAYQEYAQGEQQAAKPWRGHRKMAHVISHAVASVDTQISQTRKHFSYGHERNIGQLGAIHQRQFGERRPAHQVHQQSVNITTPA